MNKKEKCENPLGYLILFICEINSVLKVSQPETSGNVL